MMRVTDKAALAVLNRERHWLAGHGELVAAFSVGAVLGFILAHVL